MRFPPCLCNYVLFPPSSILCSTIFVPSSQWSVEASGSSRGSYKEVRRG